MLETFNWILYTLVVAVAIAGAIYRYSQNKQAPNNTFEHRSRLEISRASFQKIKQHIRLFGFIIAFLYLPTSLFILQLMLPASEVTSDKTLNLNRLKR